MAAAIGAGLPVGEPTGSMIVDVGAGSSEVAVISLGGIVVSQSILIGGDEFDEAIIDYLTREYKLLIGQQTAEEVKLEIGSAHPMEEEVQAEIRGRDVVSGLPKTVVITSEEIRQVFEAPLSQIIDAVKGTLDRTPPELSSDIMVRGIMLAGGGSLLEGLDERLHEATQMPCHLAEAPLTCVAIGGGRLLDDLPDERPAGGSSTRSRFPSLGRLASWWRQQTRPSAPLPGTPCPSSKDVFATRAEAQHSVEGSQRRHAAGQGQTVFEAPLDHAYLCPHCGQWHVSSKPGW